MDAKVYKTEAEAIKTLIEKYNLVQESPDQDVQLNVEETADNSIVWVFIIVAVLIIGSIAGLTYWMLN